MESPVGPLRLVSNGTALTAVTFVDASVSPPARVSDDGLITEARRQLSSYFGGELTEFDLPVAPAGTPFQLRVWEQLQRIPFGATASYGDIAARLGMPAGASRAVGLANGANPIAIIVPCHRVIGSDGTLIGYAGGLPRKRFLLGLEAPTVQDALFDA
jgi:methylated-DNA-[protein]-cysteine S-methyltransferase